MYFQATTKNITKTNTLKDKIQMFKAAKIIFTCTLLLLFFAKTNASDFNSAVPIYVIVVDSCLSIKSSGWNIKFDDKACEVLKIKEFTPLDIPIIGYITKQNKYPTGFTDVNDCFQNEHNAVSELYRQTPPANIVPLEIQKEWPQYFKLGKHYIKNPVYVIAEDVVGKDKATVIVLTILTGPIGGHRLYLGTKPIVPIFYTCTLGCVFVLPTIDLFVICFSKDISRFENSDKINMWAN